jgi:hypothetical protein
MKNILNTILGRYKTHKEAVIISTFFNPMRSYHRTQAFQRFYESIKHLNHRIVEIVIGDAKPELPQNPNISHVFTPSLLWHKETGLNELVKTLPKQFKYVFWVDADVLFTNKDWLVDGVKELQQANIIQPFSRCFHLEMGETRPSDEALIQSHFVNEGDLVIKDRRVWNSFCFNYVNNKDRAASENYDLHGHIGFAWGARREVLEAVPLYDKALIGGADHIIGHAAAGHIPHKCITKSFTEDIEAVTEWSKKFYSVVEGKIGYVRGNLYHLWHGDIAKRQYLKRIKEFTPAAKTISEKDENGHYVNKDKKKEEYMNNYFRNREVVNKHDDDGFFESVVLGYVTDVPFIGRNAMGSLLGASLNDTPAPQQEVSASLPTDVPLEAESKCECQSNDQASVNNSNENFS